MGAGGVLSRPVHPRRPDLRHQSCESPAIRTHEAGPVRVMQRSLCTQVLLHTECQKQQKFPNC
jgi:hypothetical protein